MDDFLMKKKCYNSTLELAAIEGREATQERGTFITLVEDEFCEEVMNEFDFIKWSDYQKHDKLGNKTNKLLPGHVEVTWKGQRGIAIFSNPVEKTRVRIVKKTWHEKKIVMATTMKSASFTRARSSRRVPIPIPRLS